MRPLLIVPGLFGTEISDDDGGWVWGKLRCLYSGGPFCSLDGLRGRPGRVMSGIDLLPGLGYDIIGALLRALRRAGYQLGETLHLFAYDWRLRVVDIGSTLAAEVRRLAERAGGPVDLLGLSNGGMVIRAAYAVDGTLPIERVVTSGTPHAGTLETVACIHGGFQFAPLGRTVSSEEFVACPGALDSIPAPEVPVFGDGRGLYDVETWRRLRMAVFKRDPDNVRWREVMAQRLNAVRETWRILAGAAAPKHLTCVCGTGLRTQVRVVLHQGGAVLPGEGHVTQLPPDALGDGDGGISIESSQAWTGARPHVIKIPVRRHRDVVRARAAFAAILEGLR